MLHEYLCVVLATSSVLDDAYYLYVLDVAGEVFVPAALTRGSVAMYLVPGNTHEVEIFMQMNTVEVLNI